jgi:RNA polymerase primary sigma factor
MQHLFRPRKSAAQSPLETYLREISETPLLTAAQEKELARRIGQGDSAARDRMACANLRLVVKIARSYVGKGLDLPDLIEEGNLGLLRAVEEFDPSRNTRFSTYAGYWITQAIQRALIYTAKTIRIPAYMAQLLVKWRRATAKLQESLGRPPTHEEVAAQLSLPGRKLNLIEQALRNHTEPHPWPAPRRRAGVGPGEAPAVSEVSMGDESISRLGPDAPLACPPSSTSATPGASPP